MKPKAIKMIIIATLIIPVIALTGCLESAAQSYALAGSVLGGIIGQAAGGDTESTLMGAAVGAGAGYIIGNEEDKRVTRNDLDALMSRQETVTVWITNSSCQSVPVRLVRHCNGMGYVGSRGEYYYKAPTPAQLCPVYGF